MEPGLEGRERRASGHHGGLDVAAREGDRRRGGVGLRAPRRVPRQLGLELLHLRHRLLDELHERRAGPARRPRAGRAAPDEPRGLEREARQGLAPRRRPPSFGRHRHGALEVTAHAVHVAGPRPGHPAPRLELAGARARWGQGRRGGGQADPTLGTVDVTELEEAHRHAAGGEELDGPVALEPGRTMGILAAGQRQVRHHLGSRVHVNPEQHLEVEPRPFALRDELRHAARHAPDLLEVARRGRQVHHGPVLGVRHGDHRRHHAGAVTEPLEDAERPLEDLRRIERSAARPATRAGSPRCRRPVASTASSSFPRPARTSPANHARPRAKSIIPISRRAAARLRSSCSRSASAIAAR